MEEVLSPAVAETSPSPPEKDIRDIVREHLVDYGIKQQWLADKLGISKTYMSNILTKYDNKNFRPHMLPIIEEALKIKFLPDQK